LCQERMLHVTKVIDVLVATLQASGVMGNIPEAAGKSPTSKPVSQPQSDGRQRITALLEAWTQQWRASQLPKLQADAYKCVPHHYCIVSVAYMMFSMHLTNVVCTHAPQSQVVDRCGNGWWPVRRRLAACNCGHHHEQSGEFMLINVPRCPAESGIKSMRGASTGRRTLSTSMRGWRG
jgi:hypothetical protein